MPEKLFIMERCENGVWKSIAFWLLPFRQIVDRFAKEELATDYFRVRRVMTLAEAYKLEDLNDTRLQLPLNIDSIEWAAV